MLPYKLTLPGLVVIYGKIQSTSTPSEAFTTPFDIKLKARKHNAVEMLDFYHDSEVLV